MSTNEDLEAACRAAALETRQALAEVERLKGELARLSAVRAGGAFPTDAVMVPSQAKVVAKIIRNQEDADEVIALLRTGLCQADGLAACATCRRYENAVRIVQRLAGIGGP